MSVRALTWALEQRFSYEETTLKLLLVILADFANDKNQCWPSQKLLSEMLGGCSLDTVQRLLKKLEAREMLGRRRRHNSDGRRTSDLMLLNVRQNRTRAAKVKPHRCGVDQAASGCGVRTPHLDAVARTVSKEPPYLSSRKGKVLGKRVEEDTWAAADDEVPA